MSAWWVVLRKELLDAFRDRRMVVVALVVMPLAVPLILAGMSSLGTKRQVEKLERTLELPVIGAEHAPNLVAWLEAQDVSAVAAPEDPDRAVRSQELEVVLRIDTTFGDDWRVTARSARAARQSRPPAPPRSPGSAGARGLHSRSARCG
jgi:sodium transport system permease protein